MIDAHAAELVQSKVGGKVLVEAASQFPDEVGAALLKAVEQEGLGLFDHPVAHRIMKKIIQTEGSGFAAKLLEERAGDLKEIMGTSNGAFVVAATIEAGGDEGKAAAKKSGLKKEAQAKIKDSKVEKKAGYEALLKVV
jgi:hypothetical protein